MISREERLSDAAAGRGGGGFQREMAMKYSCMPSEVSMESEKASKPLTATANSHMQGAS